ncbi:peptide-methionine (S)-S-oxide reductase MsrA [Streptomyces sp. CA-278952]|uniref:peptide-methionine (S)-S-oxide reductase MsrA n=1 Tax=unclassified Streptomyces TaxID=2593676 RepID=UPI002241B536|nr:MULTISPECIES: peptide-methionine (S)-S-oxide reductase MsrA [unclassified Streptomyces]UZI31666.1 peptide-methionine (S)-S-oxide reductase MsrA [Streptomyces sp. VB1]WDG31716.1 peptide-methionine (S)-S-oxide reductase MsrA [Streptomyces sp. CA-278952]
MSSNEQILTLGPGCFWSFDAVARRTPGITSSVAGYAGDDGPPPDYAAYQRSGHNPQKFVEAVQVTFQPDEVSIEEILVLFFQSHDPTTPNQSGADRGSIYHSTIFYSDEHQRAAAEKIMDLVRQKLDGDIVTDVRPSGQFIVADADQQDFYNKHRYEPYCRSVIQPKLRTLGLEVN